MQLLANWEVIKQVPSQPTSYFVTYGMASFWVQIVTSWFATLCYLWTLFAPRVCPERDFDFE